MAGPSVTGAHPEPWSGLTVAAAFGAVSLDPRISIPWRGRGASAQGFLTLQRRKCAWFVQATPRDHGRAPPAPESADPQPPLSLPGSEDGEAARRPSSAVWSLEVHEQEARGICSTLALW